jgi:hypothetical protein
MAQSRTVSVDKLISELASLDARRRRVVAAIHHALSALGTTLSDAGVARPRTGRRPGFKMSAEARAKIAAAQRRRWAKVRGKP